MRRVRKVLLLLIASLTGICIIAAGISALINWRLPTQSRQPDQLGAGDRDLIAEAQNLRRERGGQIWPGWEKADIAVISYNEANAFLTGIEDPSAGWVKVPETSVRGGSWQLLPGEALNGAPVYYQPVTDADKVIGAFTVKVGDHWAACFGTQEWSKISFARGFGADLPPVVRPFFPYPLVYRFLMGDAPRYIAGLEHEMFHSYQGSVAPDRLIAAEKVGGLEASYPWDDASSNKAWAQETDVLAQAVQADTSAERVDLARQFLQIRQQRRASLNLSAELVNYERQREWLEGLAKYAELSISMAAAQSGYTPLESDALRAEGFKGYTSYTAFYQGQLREVARMDSYHSETRFYYTGMAQAMILDQLDPTWKARALQDGVYLEDLLAEAAKQ
jgi:hypothetical protein